MFVVSIQIFRKGKEILSIVSNFMEFVESPLEIEKFLIIII